MCWHDEIDENNRPLLWFKCDYDTLMSSSKGNDEFKQGNIITHPLYFDFKIRASELSSFIFLIKRET